MSHRQGQSAGEIAAIERLIQRFIARYRLQRAVQGALEGACLGLMLALIGVAAMRTGWADPDKWWLWALITALFTAAGALFRGLRPIDPLIAAQTLDRTHGLHDRLSTALALARQDDLTRQDHEFVAAQLRDALRFIDQVDPRKAAPWRRPADTRLLAILALAVIAVGIVPAKDHRQPLPPPLQIHHDAVLDELTLALEKDRLDELRRQLEELPDQKAEQILDEIEALLEAVENRQITERQFLEAIDEILARHFADDSTEAELETMADVLAQAAEQARQDHKEFLAENPELQEALEALEESDLSAASEALAKFAEKLKAEELTSEQAEQLADLFESFADKLDDHQEMLQELFEKNRDLFEELSRQFENSPDGLTQEQQDLLNDAEQAMKDAEEALEDFNNSDSKRRLETLARHLTDTAEETRKGMGDAEDAGDEESLEEDHRQHDRQNDEEQRGDDDGPNYQNEIGRKMDDAARELKEMDKERQRSEQRQQARRQLEEMRETMARQNRSEGQESDQRRGEQMQDFMDRARGEEPGEQEGDSGQEQQGPGSEQAQQGGEQVEGNESGDGQQQDMGPGQEGDHDQEGSGNQAGKDGASDDRLDADAQELDAQRQLEVVQAQESQEGRSRSEIIKSAGEEGFATVDYRDVFVDYESIAEEVMEREEVPDGYRFYIKRYFQLIRPQDR